ncbi:MAG: hypothetical protein DDT20_01890 [Firmicutes bacterium]|nr:hypothetical protein [Bacillota bacterium]
MAIATTPASRDARQACSTTAESKPITAATAPCPTGTAACISLPRSRTKQTALSKLKAPAATKAEYSPKERPTVAAGVTPCLANTRSTAMLMVSTAGCVVSVWVSCSAGPPQITSLSGELRALFAAAKTSAASLNSAAISMPIPTYWLPWPGNKNTSLSICASLAEFQFVRLETTSIPGPGECP